MAGTGRIYVTAVREVGTIQSTHQYDVDVRFDIAFDYGGYNTAACAYSISCDSQTQSGSSSFNVASGGGSWVWTNIGGTKTFRVTMPTSGKSKTIKLSATINTGVNPSTISASGSYTLSAVTWQWTVSYNANGGSGAPGNQTKTYGTDLTLSSTKPTRTGYTFKGWATSSGGSVAYAAGAKYTANAAVTLYAVWQINTYAVAYNANGGSGAPDSQTKTYGKDLTLSTTVPTRTNYNFLGWATSSTASTPQYASGALYTANAAVTLYAVWELAYWKPKITNLSADRCSSSGDSDDYGTYAKVKFNWECCQITGSNNVKAITIYHKLKTETTWTSTAVITSGTSGRVIQVIGSGNLDIESDYDIQVTVTDDKGGLTPLNTSIGGAKFPFDILAEGKGIAFGKPATLDDTLESAYNVKFNKKLEVEGDTVINHLTATGGYFTGGVIEKIPVSSSGDCNLFTMTGKYYIGNNGTNKPTNLNGWLEVYQYDDNFVHQRYTTYTGEIYSRVMQSGTWGGWRKDSANQKILWSGAYHMNASQTATLSEAISNQPNGIVLCFNYYNNNEVSGYSNCYFVPKSLVPNGSVTCICSRNNFNNVGVKVLYVKDTSIVGYASNTNTGTASGITYYNDCWVLTKVIGV